MTPLALNALRKFNIWRERGKTFHVEDFFNRNAKCVGKKPQDILNFYYGYTDNIPFLHSALRGLFYNRPGHRSHWMFEARAGKYDVHDYGLDEFSVRYGCRSTKPFGCVCLNNKHNLNTFNRYLGALDIVYNHCMTNSTKEMIDLAEQGFINWYRLYENISGFGRLSYMNYSEKKDHKSEENKKIVLERGLNVHEAWDMFEFWGDPFVYAQHSKQKPYEIKRHIGKSVKRDFARACEIIERVEVGFFP
jgi:hypothetical protein